MVSSWTAPVDKLVTQLLVGRWWRAWMVGSHNLISSHGQHSASTRSRKCTKPCSLTLLFFLLTKSL